MPKQIQITIKCKKLTNYLRMGNAQTEFIATTFEAVCCKHKQNNNQKVRFDSQKYKIEKK